MKSTASSGHYRSLTQVHRQDGRYCNWILPDMQVFPQASAFAQRETWRNGQRPFTVSRQQFGPEVLAGSWNTCLPVSGARRHYTPVVTHQLSSDRRPSSNGEKSAHGSITTTFQDHQDKAVGIQSHLTRRKCTCPKKTVKRINQSERQTECERGQRR